MQNGGSLSAYDTDRNKIWDSHENVDSNGEYSSDLAGVSQQLNALNEKVSGSTLKMSERGVFIYEGEVVTWQIASPEWSAPTGKPSSMPTPQPSTARPSAKPSTARPSVQPTVNQVVAATGEIQGFVWDDTITNDAVYNSGDVPLVSIPISLHVCNPDNLFSETLEDDVYIGSTTTSADGTFNFNVESGRYRVRVTPVVDGVEWSFVEKGVNGESGGGSGAEDSDVNGDGSTDCIVIGGSDGGGAMDQNVYVGMIQADTTTTIDGSSVSVSGQVFLDTDGDGLQDESTSNSSSSLVDNIIIDLYDCSTTTAATNSTWIILTRTDSTGKYLFTTTDGSNQEVTDLTVLLSEMGISQFRAKFSGLPSGYGFSPASKDSDVDEEGETSCWDLDVDGVGGIVWNAGITSAAVTATTSNPTNRPTTNRPTMQPSSQPSVALSIVGGYAFFDADDNGLRDSDTTLEPAMSNINVRLFSCDVTSDGSDDVMLAVGRTNSQGIYNFLNLSRGYYRVNAQAPSGYVFSSVWSGVRDSSGILTNPSVDSTVDPATGNTQCFALAKGDKELDWSFGLKYEADVSSSTKPSSNSTAVVISGFVFHDENNDGYYDAGEEALSKVNAALFDCDGNITLLSETDDNGMYGFPEVEPGSYYVKFSSTGYEPSSVWSGDTSDANNNADPSTGATTCAAYVAGDEVYSLDAGMVLSTTEEDNLLGDGTPCSGGKCPIEGNCRNIAGLCGGGLSFCNPQSVWTPDCSDLKEEVPATPANPTTSPVTVAPTVSSAPSISVAPSSNPSVSLKPSLDTTSVCNDDGTYGVTASSKEDVESTEVTFIYSLIVESGAMTDVIAEFEEELNLRLACQYFDDPCLKCDNDSSASSRLRRRLTSGLRSLTVEGSVVTGLNSKPLDELSRLEGECSGFLLSI